MLKQRFVKAMLHVYAPSALSQTVIAHIVIKWIFRLVGGRYLQAAAALVRGGSVGGPAAPLLRLLCRAPACEPDPDLARLASFAWHWVAAGVPNCLVRLLPHLCLSRR